MAKVLLFRSLLRLIVLSSLLIAQLSHGRKTYEIVANRNMRANREKQGGEALSDKLKKTEGADSSEAIDWIVDGNFYPTPDPEKREEGTSEFKFLYTLVTVIALFTVVGCYMCYNRFCRTPRPRYCIPVLPATVTISQHVPSSLSSSDEY